MVINNYNETTVGYVSTLLIPEKTAWLPYVGLVATVLVWLGYDFYRFHRTNNQKYARMEEHMTILRAAPSRERISMVSGIGLRFRRGKPILGDVWNTSPSSSDMSGYCGTRRNALASYSREVTPSDEGGEYSDTDLFAGSKSESCADLVEHEVHNSHQRIWEIGEDDVHGSLRNYAGTLPDPNKRQEECTAQNYMQDDIDPVFVIPSSRSSSSTAVTSTTTTAYDDHKYHTIKSEVICLSDDMDDEVGGIIVLPYKDATTQTVLSDVRMNLKAVYNDISLQQGNTYLYPGYAPHLGKSSPNIYRHGETSEYRSPNFHTGGSQQQPEQFFADSSSPRHSLSARPVNSPTVISKHPSGKAEKRYPPPLRLDLISGQYSPTAEIVASKHGFAVEGLEVPHGTTSGGRPLTSRESDGFKSSKSQGHSIFKALSPSPAVTCRVSPSHPVSPRQSMVHFNNHQPSPSQPIRHRHKRQESLSFTSSGNSKTVSPSKRNSQTVQSKSKHPRTLSSPPRLSKINDDSEEAVSLKMFKDASVEPPKSAPIPTHLYHQDEEGFFSSITSSSQSRRMLSREADDFTNKGILFFSRLAGIGRNQDPGMASRQGQGSYKTGGFES